MKKEEQRFVSTKTGVTVQKSQCVGCIYNRGLKCVTYGNKPLEYASAHKNKKCPERKSEK